MLELELRKDWVLTKDMREKALAKRHQVRGAQLADKTKDLGVLELGTIVQVQNQSGVHAKKWDLSGVVVEVLGYDSYLVKMDGSGRVSKRNRQFLRPIKTFSELLKGKKQSPLISAPSHIDPNKVVPAYDPYGCANSQYDTAGPEVRPGGNTQSEEWRYIIPQRLSSIY